MATYHIAKIVADIIRTLPDDATGANGETLATGRGTFGLLGSGPVHIPDPDGRVYKTDLVLFSSPEKTVKLVFWYGADPRPAPHTHPWPFTSYILRGGYVEDRYTLTGEYISSHNYTAGDVNVCPVDVAHRVVVVRPGTVTKMVCGPQVPGNVWHEVEGGALVLPDKQAFLDKFLPVNPFVKG